MKTQGTVLRDDFDNPLRTAEGDEETSEDELWFLPGPMEDEPDRLASGLPTKPRETGIVEDWARAEAGCAARLARVAGRLGALNDRLLRGPEGWRRRLAVIEAAHLSWFAGDRVGPDQLALWMSMRVSGVQEDTAALARVEWAVRRLMGGPGPELDLAAFLDRRDLENGTDETEPFSDRAGGWLEMMSAARDLHPITRACMGFHLWSLAGLGLHGDHVEAAVTSGRIAASEASWPWAGRTGCARVDRLRIVSPGGSTGWRAGSSQQCVIWMK
jgi:hypothetical protein